MLIKNISLVRYINGDRNFNLLSSANKKSDYAKNVANDNLESKNRYQDFTHY